LHRSLDCGPTTRLFIDRADIGGGATPAWTSFVRDEIEESFRKFLAARALDDRNHVNDAERILLGKSIERRGISGLSNSRLMNRIRGNRDVTAFEKRIPIGRRHGQLIGRSSASF